MIRTPIRLAPLGAGLTFAALLMSCTSSPAPDAPPSTVTPPAGATPAPAPGIPLDSPRVVATGLDAPWSIVFLQATTLGSEHDSGRILEIAVDGGQTVGS